MLKANDEYANFSRKTDGEGRARRTACKVRTKIARDSALDIGFVSSQIAPLGNYVDASSLVDIGGLRERRNLGGFTHYNSRARGFPSGVCQPRRRSGHEQAGGNGTAVQGHPPGADLVHRERSGRGSGTDRGHAHRWCLRLSGWPNYVAITQVGIAAGDCHWLAYYSSSAFNELFRRR